MLFFAELVIPTKIGLTCAFISVPKSGVKIKILGWPPSSYAVVVPARVSLRRNLEIYLDIE